MLKNVCTADQPEADREHPFLRVGNGGGETEPQPFQKSKLWAFFPTYSHTLDVCLLKGGNTETKNHLCYS